ncbi:MAG: hypothetical protein CMA63_05445 [Euryarchaeota archaeon]|nr:hypothetical protein [Euryarchaeota archaeon]
MKTGWEFYSEAFNAEALFGFRMLIAWGSLLILLWCVALSALVWRANSKSYENKFMSVLLVCEGIKASFIVSSGILYIRRYEWLQDILWVWTIDVFFVAHITTVILYLCIPMYYRLNKLSFMYKPLLRSHAWYIAPLLALSIYSVLRGHPDFYVADAAWVVCTEGSAATLDMWFGSHQPWMDETVAELGTCAYDFETTITSQPIGLWAIALGSPLISLMALLFIRSSLRSYASGDNPDASQNLSSRSLYIGFVGKVVGLIVWMTLTAVLLPLLHGGPVTFVDETIWRYGADPTTLDRLKYFLWTGGLLLTPAAIAFEAMMFVHATLNDTVFGIDNNLRKAFRTAVFTGLGLVAFIIGSEAMESVVGYGMAGGIMVGLALLAIRRPILNILDRVSSRFIPESHTSEETAYLGAYATAMDDLIITKEERKLLQTVASAYGLDSQTVEKLESEYDASLAEE